MSLRFVKQRDEYSCAPVALLNLCKWAGVGCAYNDDLYCWIKEHCECKPRYGSSDPFIHATLLALAREYNWAVRFRVEPSAAQLRDELDNGNAVLLCGMYDDDEDHIALVIDYDKRGLWAVNWWFDSETVRRIGWKYLETLRSRKPLLCWFVRQRFIGLPEK